MQILACFRLSLCDAKLNKLLIPDAMMGLHSSIEKTPESFTDFPCPLLSLCSDAVTRSQELQNSVRPKTHKQSISRGRGHTGTSSTKEFWIRLNSAVTLLLLLRHLLVRIWAGLPPLPTMFLRLARSLAVIVDIPAIIMIVLVWSSSARTTNPPRSESESESEEESEESSSEDSSTARGLW